MSCRRPSFLWRLLGASVLLSSCAVMVTIGAAFVLSEREGFAAFVSSDATTTTSAEPAGGGDGASSEPEPVPASTTTPATAPPAPTSTSAAEAAPVTSTSSTTSTTVPDGLHDIPPHPRPLSYEVLLEWHDGPARVTVLASSSTATDPAGLEAHALAPGGGWELLTEGRLDGGTLWAVHAHPDHSWCLYVEVFAPGTGLIERGEAAGLPGPQYLVAESPYCDVTPGAFA